MWLSRVLLAKVMAVMTLIALLAPCLSAKKKKGDETQTLALPAEPPAVATGQTSRLIFHVSPLSNKGLLSQQTRDALKAIVKLNGGVPVIHIRALVAGSGDVRRVPQIVSEVFGEKHLPLPSVSVVQIGALPLEGAQVVIEAAAEGKKDVNPDGLTFGVGPSPAEALHGAMPLLVTCFANHLEPMPGVNVVQMRREPVSTGPICEAVGRGGSVKDARLMFSGTQVAFGADEHAKTLAVQRLDRELGSARVLLRNVYSVAGNVDGMPPNSRLIPVEAVASSDGSFAMDAVAAP